MTEKGEAMKTSEYIYHHHDQAFHGYLAYPDQKDLTPLPAVLIVHDWGGRNQFACQKADMLAEKGYLAFAVDMFGKGQLGNTLDEKMALMQPLIQDRKQLRDRIKAAFQAVLEMKNVNSDAIAAMGFCFGGLCALDLARSGVNLKGAISFHGLLDKPKPLKPEPIKAKILALHGYDDPMVTPDKVDAFCQEMTEAGADWQLHAFGHTQHAFTNPQAQDEKMGTVYNALAEARAMRLMADFFKEVFNQR